MKSHTGGTLSLGKGTIYSTSKKQKLNTKSSTESELVGIDDIMPQILWTRYFLSAQGFEVKDNLIYQDNQSCMKLAINGRASSGKRTRHINIRYFFITDRIKSNEVNIKYCPTEMLLADFYTKPLQGSLFKIFRNMILNINDKQVDYFLHMQKKIRDNGTVSADNDKKRPQECVGNEMKI